MNLLNCLAVGVFVTASFAAEKADFQVLATSKTSTMEKEMNEAAAAGFVFADVMGGNSAFGGKEVIVIMSKGDAGKGPRKYKLLATSKTSTMEKEMQEAGNEGFEYRGQTVFESVMGGREVAVILERDPAKAAGRLTYKLLATSKTSTMEKELKEAGAQGFQLMGMTLNKTAFGGSEVVCIMAKTK